MRTSVNTSSRPSPEPTSPKIIHPIPDYLLVARAPSNVQLETRGICGRAVGSLVACNSADRRRILRLARDGIWGERVLDLDSLVVGLCRRCRIGCSDRTPPEVPVACPPYVEMQLGVIMKDLELCVREWNDVPLA